MVYLLNTVTTSNGGGFDACLLNCWFIPFFLVVVNVALLEQKQIKQVTAINILQKITLSLKLFFYGYFVVLVSFPHLLLYHYSLRASSYIILSSASVNRNDIIKSQPAAYSIYTFMPALAALFPSRSLFAFVFQKLSMSKCGRFAVTQLVRRAHWAVSTRCMCSSF